MKSSGIVGEGSVFYFDIPGFVRLRREDDVSRGTDKQERHSLSSPGPQELSTAATVQMIALSGAENNFSSMSSSSVIIEHRDSYEAPAAGATSEILILGADAPSLNMEGKIALVVDDSKLNRKMIMKLINDKFEVILEVGLQHLVLYSCLIFLIAVPGGEWGNGCRCRSSVPAGAPTGPGCHLYGPRGKIACSFRLR